MVPQNYAEDAFFAAAGNRCAGAMLNISDRPGSSQSEDQEAQGCIPRAQPVRDEQDLEQASEAGRPEQI